MDRNVPEMSMVTSPFGKLDGKYLNHFDVVRYAKTYDNGAPEWAKENISTDYCAYEEGGRSMQLAYHQGRGYGLIKDEEGVPLCTLGVTTKDTPQMQRWFKALVKKAMLCHPEKIVSVQATHFDIPLQRFLSWISTGMAFASIGLTDAVLSSRFPSLGRSVPGQRS